jgi:serine/threonine-protein kinase
LPLRPEIPESLASAVAKAMAKDQAQRYEEAQDLAIDLASAFHDLGRPPAELAPEQKFQYIRELAFFNPFSDNEVREVVRACEWERYERGQPVVSEGNLEHAFYIVVSGEVAVTKRGKRIATLGKGESFGEMGFIGHTERTATVVALEPLTLIKIDSSLLDQASMTCQLRFNQVFLLAVTERLARTSDELAQHMA